MQLVRADVDGIDASRATIQQDLRKPPGRCADIKTNPALRIKTESGRSLENWAMRLMDRWDFLDAKPQTWKEFVERNNRRV